ncbi:MAG TPA: DUF6266 family protein, partial [Pedobacter sp.]
ISNWRDVTVGRSTPKKSTKPPTPAQLDQQSQFGLVTGFLGNISDILALGYQFGPKGITPMNAAVRYHLNTAVKGAYPEYQLDYTKVVISNGNAKNEIDGGIDASALAVADAKVTVSWITAEHTDDNPTLPADLACLVFYSTTKQRFVTFKGKAERSLLSTTVQIPRSFVGDNFQGYLFFVSPNRKSVSFSDYLGSFTLIA